MADQPTIAIPLDIPDVRVLRTELTKEQDTHHRGRQYPHDRRLSSLRPDYHRVPRLRPAYPASPLTHPGLCRLHPHPPQALPLSLLRGSPDDDPALELVHAQSATHDSLRTSPADATGQ